MPRVGIIGAGLIGRSWAIVFARAGWDVVLYDQNSGVAEEATALITEALVKDRQREMQRIAGNGRTRRDVERRRERQRRRR